MNGCCDTSLVGVSNGTIDEEVVMEEEEEKEEEVVEVAVEVAAVVVVAAKFNSFRSFGDFAKPSAAYFVSSAPLFIYED